MHRLSKKKFIWFIAFNFSNNSIFKNKFIVNLGISSYQGEETRVRERGTSNHSTLLIDGKNSSDVWGEFRVGQRAKIISKNISREKVHTKNDKIAERKRQQAMNKY